MSEFFHMGGYGAFVWGAYGVAAVLMVALLVASWRAARSRDATLAALQAQSPHRRGGRESGR